MELVVLRSEKPKAIEKFDSMLERLNTRIMQKVDNCNNILDQIDLISDEEKNRRANWKAIADYNNKVYKDLIKLKIKLAKETEFTYMLNITDEGCTFINQNGGWQDAVFYPNVINFIDPTSTTNSPTVTVECTPTIEDIHTYYICAAKMVQSFITKYNNEHNEGESGTGDKQLSTDNAEVSI